MTAAPDTPPRPPVVERGRPEAARDETQRAERSVDVLIVGGGPAGLSAALNLGRARATVAVIDADRPRNAATLRSHGFLTRDGIPPQELRAIARDELAAYPNVTVHRRTRVTSIERDDNGFTATLEGRGAPAVIHARSVLAATGLRETLPTCRTSAASTA